VPFVVKTECSLPISFGAEVCPTSVSLTLGELQGVISPPQFLRRKRIRCFTLPGFEWQSTLPFPAARDVSSVCKITSVSNYGQIHSCILARCNWRPSCAPTDAEFRWIGHLTKGDSNAVIFRIVSLVALAAGLFAVFVF
jgi:hypothetical protein